MTATKIYANFRDKIRATRSRAFTLAEAAEVALDCFGGRGSLFPGTGPTALPLACLRWGMRSPWAG